MFTYVVVAFLLAGPIYSTVPQFTFGEYVPPKFAEVWQNGSVGLQCSSRGFPETSYSWYKLIEGTKEKQSVALNDRFAQVSDKLIITEANVEDAGRYLCVSNTSLGIESLETILTIIIPLKVSIKPQVQTIAVGKPAYFTCHVEGNSNKSISWWKDGVRIEHHGTVLLISSVKIKDQGMYRCSVRNNCDTAEATAQLKLEGRYEPPQILSAFREKILQPDSNVYLKCMASGNPTPEITWEVSGERIADGDRVQVDQYLNDNGDAVSHLNMTSVHTNDGGVYKCSATNELGSEVYSARINVYGLPYVRPMENISIVAGDMLIVTCPVVGHPIESIAWEHNNRSLPINRNQKVFPNGTLIIKNFVSDPAQHTYTCIAKDPEGYSARATLEVHVLAPPKFEIKQYNQTSHLGSPAVLQCEAVGDKPIDIFWNINGKRLESVDNRYTIHKQIMPNRVKSDLSIKRIERSDSTIFTCVAINAFGSDNTTINMIVQEVPGVPHDVEIIDKSERSIKLSWAPPYDGNSSIKQYQIEYKISEGSWVTDIERVSVSGEHNEASIIGLRPGIIFHLRIVAVNEVGRSEPSDTIQFVTAEEAPSGPPKDVRVESANAHTLNVWWKSPKRADWNGKILGYNVGYKLTDSNNTYIFQSTKFRRELGKDNHLEIRELKTYTPYSIVVQAFNKVGLGPISKALIQYTAEGPPDQPPRDTTCVALTSKKICISWVSPPLTAANGVIKGYKVIYGPSDSWSNYENKDTIKTSSSKIFLHRLQKYTNYTMQVLAYTAGGDGVLSSPIQCQTEEDLPDKPANIKALATSSSSVLVSWKPPAKPNGLVEQYTVYVNEVSNNSREAVKLSYKVQPTQMIYEVTELEKSKTYEFFVTASTYIGEGDPSLTLVQSPAEQIPARIMLFSDILTTTYNKELKLPCTAVGVLLSEIIWKINGRALVSYNLVHKLPDGSLLIKRVKREDKSEYSCHVKNQYGEDFITYKLIVYGPPRSPRVTLLENTATNITLKLQANLTDTTPLHGYIIYYNSLTVKLTSPVKKYTLENLSCGTTYDLYVKGYNSIGRGEASNVLIIKTNGSVPIKAEYADFIKPLYHGVSLNLDTWSDGGCPISYFNIDCTTNYGLPKFSSSKVKPGGDFIIKDLLPSEHYTVRVTAFNDAGHTGAVYNFRMLQPNNYP